MLVYFSILRDSTTLIVVLSGSNWKKLTAKILINNKSP